MASWLIRIASSPGKSSRSRREICCGLHALAQRRCCRRPWRRPFQVTAGPATAAPPGATTAPASRSRTYARSAGFVASLAGFGRCAARSACHWAVVARYSSPPPRVAAWRRSSRETVDAARPSRRATSRTPCPCARHSATSSRSANDRYRPEGGPDDRASVDGGMPPASRNQRTPTAGDTPTSTAASSLDRPAAIAVQNRRRSSRRATPGRPGERDTPRPDRSERRLRVPIANPSAEVSRRPLESAQYASGPYRAILARHGLVQSMSREGDCWDNAPMESFFGSLKNELVHRTTFPTREAARRAIFEYVEAFYNRRRRHSGLGFLTPAQAHEQMAGAA